MQTWPDNLPKPQTQLDTDDNAQVARSKLVEGLIGQRKRFSGQTSLVNVVWEMTNEQLGYFQAFRQFVLNMGSDWFLCPIPLDGTETNRQVRFVDGAYSISYAAGNRWKVTAKLDLDAEPFISEADLDDILDDAAELVDDTGEPFVTDGGHIIYVRL